ncbi:MAG: porin, partial [Terracidiphilus sp.]
MMRALIAVFILAACMPYGRAQDAASLPDAPAPVSATGQLQVTFADEGSDMSAERGAELETPAAPPEAEMLTMFPHSDTAPYWVSGQANSIFQAHGHFRSPYEGTNSLLNIFEYKASEVATLYLGYQWHANTRYNTDFIVDFENAGGRGISEALGLAGETNLDVVRNPNLSTTPYISRGEIHQI